nr:flagellar hook-length control protein FliK [Mesorhizobium sp.]
MTSIVSASRSAIADPRPQASKNGSKEQSGFQDAFRAVGAERRSGTAVAVQAMAVPSKGLSRQLEGLAEVGLRLSGTAAEASAAMAAQVHRPAAAAVPVGRPTAEQSSLVEGDVDRAGRSGATKQVRAEASARAPTADSPADGITAPSGDIEPTEPEAAGGDAGEVETETALADDTSEWKPRAPRTAGEDVAPAFALLEDALRIPRQQMRAAAEETPGSGPSAALDTSRDDAEATARSSAPKSAAASVAAASPPPPEAPAGSKADTPTMAAPREVPVPSTPSPSIERMAVGTIAAPPAQPSPRGQGVDRTNTRASDGTAGATSPGRTPPSATNAQSPTDTAAAAAPAEASDRTPPPREPVEREAQDDGGKPGASDSRSGETARPAPNGVTAVSAQSAQVTPPATPAAAIIATVRAEGSWAAYFRDTQPGAPAQLKSLKIQLNPVELGAVTAHLRIKDDIVTVELSAETADAQRQLTTDADTIAKSLRALGLDIDRVTVQVASRSDAQPQPEPNGQSRQQGFAADGGAGGAREQGSGSRREQHQSGGQNTHAAGPPGAVPNGSSSARYI